MIQQILPIEPLNPLARPSDEVSVAPGSRPTLRLLNQAKAYRQSSPDQTTVPFDVLTGSFWLANLSTSSSTPPSTPTPIQKVAVDHRATETEKAAWLAQLSYWLLVLALGGTCCFLATFFLKTMPTDRQDQDLTTISSVVAGTLADSRP